MKNDREIVKQLLEEIRTLKHRKGFLKAGIPNYDRLFGRDALIAAWQLLDWNPGICKATLEILSQLQGKVVNDEREEEPGKILHETEFGRVKHTQKHFPFPYYGTVEATPLFLIVFYFYLRKTNDKKFLKNHWDNILMALHWMERYGDKDKDYFLEYQRKNPTGLFHQGWKDGFEDHLRIEPPVAIVEAQGYQYFALDKVVDLLAIRKDWELVERVAKRAAKLKSEFNKKFWMPDQKFFALALDGKKRQRKAITSNPGYLLFTGIIQGKERERLVVERLFKDDMWTPFGLRTHSAKEPDFDPRNYHLGSVWPHDNWIIAQGLKKLGYAAEYRKIKDAIFAAWREFKTLPEHYGVDRSGKPFKIETALYPQAWATGSLFNFLCD